MFLMVIKHLTDKSLDVLMDVMVWSFQVMENGIWPHNDPSGEPWPRKSNRAKRAGTQLGNGYRGTFVELLADWKFQKEVLHMHRHYNKNQICGECNACKGEGPLNLETLEIMRCTAAQRSRYLFNSTLHR